VEAGSVTEHQRLFLAQARTDFAVFEWFRKAPNLPACHALHYLQMATEMLGKAHAWKHGKPKKTHRAFARFLRSLSTNRQAQAQFGYQGRTENWRHMIRKSVPLAEGVEDLAPSLARDGPNPEYPWPDADPQVAPAEFTFAIWQDLQQTGAGRKFLDLTSRLFAVADAFL
jgi:hypothetical protein